MDFLNIKLRLIAALRASAGYQASCARPIPTTTTRTPITCVAFTTNNCDEVAPSVEKSPFIIYPDDLAQTKKNPKIQSRNCLPKLRLRNVANIVSFSPGVKYTDCPIDPPSHGLPPLKHRFQSIFGWHSKLTTGQLAVPPTPSASRVST